MANVTYSFEDTLGLEEAFNKSIYDMPWISIISRLSLGDEVGLRPSTRYVRDFVEMVGVQQRIGHHPTDRHERSYSTDFVSVFEEFNLHPSNRFYAYLSDFLSIDEAFVFKSSDRIYLEASDVIAVYDIQFPYNTYRHKGQYDHPLHIGDTLEIMANLIVIGGTGSGAYLAGEIVTISVELDNDEHFAAWVGDVSRIVSTAAKTTQVVLKGGTTKITAVKDKVPRGFVSAGDIMSAAIVDLVMQQGSVFKRNVYYKDSNGDPVVLSGYTAAMQIRKAKNSTTTELSMSTSSGELNIDPGTGRIEVHIPANIVDLLDFDYGFYDLELYPEGDTNQAFRILEGRIKLVKQVTR